MNTVSFQISSYVLFLFVFFHIVKLLGIWPFAVNDKQMLVSTVSPMLILFIFAVDMKERNSKGTLIVTVNPFEVLFRYS